MPHAQRDSMQEYWSGLPCPPPGDLPDPGMKPAQALLRARGWGWGGPKRELNALDLAWWACVVQRGPPTPLGRDSPRGSRDRRPFSRAGAGESVTGRGIPKPLLLAARGPRLGAGWAGTGFSRSVWAHSAVILLQSAPLWAEAASVVLPSPSL